MIPRRADMVVTRWGGARFMGRRFPCSIGRGGISGTKQEGDGVTPPAGIWHLLGGGGFRADRRLPPHAPFLVRAIGPADIWSDDPPTDPAYNQGLRAMPTPPSATNGCAWGGHRFTTSFWSAIRISRMPRRAKDRHYSCTSGGNHVIPPQVASPLRPTILTGFFPTGPPRSPASSCANLLYLAGNILGG